VYHNPFANCPLSLDVFDGEFDEQFAANREGLYERVPPGLRMSSVPLWTLEEDRSDLEIELTLREMAEGLFVAEIDNLHVP
jgi:hypothetical protein